VEEVNPRDEDKLSEAVERIDVDRIRSSFRSTN
jgi:hypothetical protein